MNAAPRLLLVLLLLAPPALAMSSDSMHCGHSWATMVGACHEAEPCPSGLNDECPVGQTCFIDTPCAGSAAQSSGPANNDMFCGESWSTMVSACGDALPCASGLNEDCPTGQTCFVGSPCGQEQAAAPGPATESVQSAAVSSPAGAIGGVGDMNCGATWALAVADDCANSQPCPSGLNDECPDGELCFIGTPCPEPPPEQQIAMASPQSASGNADPVVDSSSWASTDTNMFCGHSWATTVSACHNAQPCPTGLSSDCPTGQHCFVDTPCGPPSPEAEPVPPPEQVEYCAATLSWLTDMNDCAETSGCPTDTERSGCPWGTRCVDCRAQPDVPTLEVRCVPHALHVSVEGCSVRCCMPDR